MKIFDKKWSVGIACHSTDHLTDIISNSSAANELLHDVKLHHTKYSEILNNMWFFPACKKTF